MGDEVEPTNSEVKIMLEVLEKESNYDAAFSKKKTGGLRLI